MKIALAQMNSGADLDANLEQSEDLIVQAAEQGAELVTLPEVMHLRVGRPLAEKYLSAAESIPGRITDRFSALARRLNVHLLLGSIGEVSPDPQRTYNTSVFIDAQGSLKASYRKVHLFDVAVDDQNGDRESERYLPGESLVLIDSPMGLAGLTICYDLRFAELYRSLTLAGARVIFVPANFTQATGKAHWMTLLRARAIENGLFIVAPAQCGAFPEGFTAYGHSTVIDPWGRVLIEMDDKPGVGVIDLDLAEVDRVRSQVPVLKHLRPDVYRSNG